jgi:ribonuclease HI
MRKKNVYAVKSGRQPGIYTSLVECNQQVAGYSKAEYRGFATRKEAEEYLRGSEPKIPGKLTIAVQTEVGVSRRVGSNHSSSLKKVIIYTDGACAGNPGPGGYGVVLIHGDHRKEISAGFRLSTNNRMEILACIVGLRALKEPCDVTIYSDSKYVVNAMTKSWALQWRRRGWKRKDQQGEYHDARNADLWQQMLDLCNQHRVKFEWVRGHSGNQGNERCDELAREAAVSDRLGVDTVYEAQRFPAPQAIAAANRI